MGHEEPGSEQEGDVAVEAEVEVATVVETEVEAAAEAEPPLAPLPPMPPMPGTNGSGHAPTEEEEFSADEDTDGEGDLVDITELFSDMDQLGLRVDSVDRGVASALKAVVLMFRSVETVINPTADPAAKAAALTKLNTFLAIMEKQAGPGRREG